MSFPKRPSCVLEKEIIHTALSMLSREAWRNSNFVLARNSLTKERGKCAVLLEKPIFVQMSVLNQNIPNMLPASFREQMPSLDKCFHLFCPSTEIPNFCYLQQISHRKKETRWNLKRFTHMHRSGVVQKIQQLTFWSRNFTFKF